MTPVAFLFRLIQFQWLLELKTKLSAWIDAMLHNNDTGDNFFFKLSLLRRSIGDLPWPGRPRSGAGQPATPTARSGQTMRGERPCPLMKPSSALTSSALAGRGNSISIDFGNRCHFHEIKPREY